MDNSERRMQADSEFVESSQVDPRLERQRAKPQAER
jgi:hypothetical protein